MKRHTPSLLVLLFLIVAAGCDSAEDPNLLNPPLADSTSVRIVNLVPNEPVSAVYPGMPIATNLPPYRISPFTRFLISEQTSLTIYRTASNRIDTIPNQTLSRGARLTYFILPRGDTGTRLINLPVAGLDRTDLTRRGEGRLVFINAVDDTSFFYLKSGCQSGDTLVSPLGYGTSISVETASRELSLYLFSSSDSAVVRSVRLQTPIASINYLIAARGPDGSIKLYLIDANGDDAGGALQEAPAETRTTATVQLLNALADNSTVSARIVGGSTIVQNLGSLQISSRADVDACSTPSGDRLGITTAGVDTVVPIRLSVGGNSLVAAFGGVTSPRVVVLNRDVPAPEPGSIYLRGVNLSAVTASISVGAGADSAVAPDTRPFGSLRTGVASNYVRLPAGSYPLILSDAGNGTFLSGGIQSFPSGYYTLFVVDRLGVPTLMLLRDDVPGNALADLEQPGIRATFFNLMPDLAAEFTIGTLKLPPLPYSYVYQTIIPGSATTVSSNAGTATITPGSGSYLIGATGTGSAHQLLAFPSISFLPPVGSVLIRFLNAIPGSGEMIVREGSVTTPPLRSFRLSFGIPSDTVQLDERKYSFVITPPDAVDTLARTDGVELVAGRRYLLVVAPKRQGSTSPLPYSLFWIQE